MLIGALIVLAVIGAYYVYTSYFVIPPSISKVPDAVKEEVKILPAGDAVVVKKVKYIEFKKLEKTPGPSTGYAGIINIMKVLVFPTIDGPPLTASEMTATASSTLGAEYAASNVLDYAAPSTMFHSRITGDVGEWLRVELKTPMALDHISILNRPDVSPALENSRIVGTQIAILDTEGSAVKTYVVGAAGDKLDFAAH